MPKTKKDQKTLDSDSDSGPDDVSNHPVEHESLGSIKLKNHKGLNNKKFCKNWLKIGQKYCCNIV